MAIAVEMAAGQARCVPMSEVVKGQEFVVGHVGVRVFPQQRMAGEQSFEFMNSAVSTEKPKGVAIRRDRRQISRNAGQR